MLTANAWNHVVATYQPDDGYARIYVNGSRMQKQQLGEFTSIASPNTSTSAARQTTTLWITHVDVNATEDDSRQCPQYCKPTDHLCMSMTLATGRMGS